MIMVIQLKFDWTVSGLWQETNDVAVLLWIEDEGLK